MSETHTPWLILTALGLEYSAVKSHLSRCLTVVHERGSRYEWGYADQAGGQKVAIVECGAGNTGAAVEGERAIAFFKPQHVLFVGVAGGIKDVALGDVVFASKVYGYESGKAKDQFLPRPQLFTTSYSILQAAKEVARNAISGSKSIVAPIAAGEKVIASVDSAEYHFIRSAYSDACAVEMEGYGFLHAGYANDVECMVVRGISDLISGKLEADASGSQERAAENAAKAAFSLIKLLHIDKVNREFDKDAFAEIAEELYPLGPNDNQLWSRAGGSLALLIPGQSGRAAWYSAIRLLLLGGGGPDITLAKLIDVMSNEHPRNVRLSAFRRT
jgi:nucleoside phosphorylase